MKIVIECGEANVFLDPDELSILVDGVSDAVDALSYLVTQPYKGQQREEKERKLACAKKMKELLQEKSVQKFLKGN